MDKKSRITFMWGLITPPKTTITFFKPVDPFSQKLDEGYKNKAADLRQWNGSAEILRRHEFTKAPNMKKSIPPRTARNKKIVENAFNEFMAELKDKRNGFGE